MQSDFDLITAKEEILLEWKKDSNINQLDIRLEILKSSSLHSKYIEKLLNFKDLYRKIELKLIFLKKVKSKYYKGEMTKEELKENGLDQYQGLKPVKSELEHLLSIDNDVIEINNDLISCKNILDMIESILNQIKSRSYDLKTFIEAEKFYNGG